MTPSIQLAVLRALSEKPMTTHGIEKAVPYPAHSVRHALKQARSMGRVEYQGTCTRGGTWVVTADGMRFLERHQDTRVCKSCGEAKPEKDFPKYSHYYPRRRPHCAQCLNGKRRKKEKAQPRPQATCHRLVKVFLSPGVTT